VERIGETRDVDVGFEGVDLPPVAISPNDDPARPESDLIRTTVEDAIGEEDHSGTGAKDRTTRGDEPSKGLDEVERAQEIRHRGALAPGQHQAVEGLEIDR
jgi:hypothetical protein